MRQERPAAVRPYPSHTSQPAAARPASRPTRQMPSAPPSIHLPRPTMHSPAKRQHRNSTDKRQKNPVPEFPRDLSYISRHLSYNAHTSAPASAPLPQRSSSHPRNRQKSCRSRSSQFACFSRRSLVISCTSLIQHPYQQSRPHTDLLLSWTIVKKRCSSWPSSTKTVFFAAPRGPSWTKKMFFVALICQNGVLRGPSRPFVDKKVFFPPPRLPHLQIHSRPILW